MTGRLAPAEAKNDEGAASLRPILTLTLREMFEMANSMGVKLSTIV